MKATNETLAEALAKTERQTIILQLHLQKGNRAATAKALGISREALYNKCIRLGIAPHHRKKSLASKRLTEQI